jgi:lysophospholipase L1-like esterase
VVPAHGRRRPADSASRDVRSCIARIVRIALRLLFSALVLALMLVATEYALRVWYRRVQSSGNAGGYFAQARRVEVISNSLGYRDREPGRKDPARYRIAVIGDSFTWGQGIEARERFSNLIEGFLGPHYEVLNFGIPGHDMPQHLDVLDQVLPLQPDFVLLQLYVNDFETAQMTRPRAHPLISDEAASGWGRTSVLYDMASGHWVQIQEATGLAESYVHYLQRNLQDPDAPNARIAFGMLRQFVEKAKSAGVPVGLVLFPMTDAMGRFGRGYPVGFIHDRVRGIAADERVPYLDLLPAFSSYRDPKSLWVSPFDAHPNAIANKRAAQEILNTFSRDWRK